VSTASRREHARRRRRRRRWIFVALLVLAAFVVGVAMGEALHDNPRPGQTQTVIVTFTP
jgi:hypothetical protein